MIETREKTYWIAVAHLPRWATERINRLIIRVIHDNKMTWSDFFGLNKKEWKDIFAFTDKELQDIEDVKKDMPRLSFIAEQLYNEGFEIIPINSPDYPFRLKDNLKIKSSPPVLYIKGKKELLQEDAVAIVGARKAGEIALEFTDHVANKCVKENKIIVSGFAKGVDKQALDSTILAKGKSIIVLPQGILTFQSGLKKYYEAIVKGDVLVLSTFFPKAGWDVGLAMARNIYIYGLATEIYVAESDNKGGTWEGVIDGLKRKRRIYVRVPLSNEKNANLKLIDLGAVPVNIFGENTDLKFKVEKKLFLPNTNDEVNENVSSYDNLERDIEKEIITFLKKGSFTSKEILLALNIGWDSRRLTGFLKKNPNIKTMSGKPAKFTLNEALISNLF